MIILLKFPQHIRSQPEMSGIVSFSTHILAHMRLCTLEASQTENVKTCGSQIQFEVDKKESPNANAIYKQKTRWIYNGVTAN